MTHPSFNVVAFPRRAATAIVPAAPGLGLLPRSLSAFAAALLVVVSVTAWSRSDLPEAAAHAGVDVIAPALPF